MMKMSREYMRWIIDNSTKQMWARYDANAPSMELDEDSPEAYRNIEVNGSIIRCMNCKNEFVSTDDLMSNSLCYECFDWDA